MDLRGLNPDIRQLERARSLVSARPGNTVFFEEGDACALPYPESRFDRVLALESIFHFPSRERFFREAFRTLRAGGTLAITDFVPSAAALPLVRLATEMPALGRFQYFGRCDLSFTRRAYRRLAERVGFVPVADQDITLHTLPTYRFLNGLVDHSPLPKGTKIAAETLLKMMSLFSNAGLLTYHLFTFQKPDGVASDKRG
jgi:ubiquinone/menaquinone biosynthesis C-methylase UbiE